MCLCLRVLICACSRRRFFFNLFLILLLETLSPKVRNSANSFRSYLEKAHVLDCSVSLPEGHTDSGPAAASLGPELDASAALACGSSLAHCAQRPPASWPQDTPGSLCASFKSKRKFTQGSPGAQGRAGRKGTRPMVLLTAQSPSVSFRSLLHFVAESKGRVAIGAHASMSSCLNSA